MDNFNNFNNLVNLIETKYNPRSAWHKGVKKYALELAESLVENYSNEDIKDIEQLKKALLNGAKNWKQYSHGGCSLICDSDIAERLSTKTELKLTKNGEKQPNKYITWLDIQVKALSQASSLVTKILSEV